MFILSLYELNCKMTPLYGKPHGVSKAPSWCLQLSGVATIGTLSIAYCGAGVLTRKNCLVRERKNQHQKSRETVPLNRVTVYMFCKLCLNKM